MFRARTLQGRGVIAILAPIFVVLASVLSLTEVRAAEGTRQPPSATKVPTSAPGPRLPLRELVMLDVRGARHALAIGRHQRGTVFVFISSECPISRQYIPELNRLADIAKSSRLEYFGVLSDSSLARRDALRFVDEFQIAFPVVFDASQEMAALLVPRYVPEAFVVDADGSLCYRGRIDDLFADIGKRRAEATRHDLLEAMTALSAGRPITVPETRPVGCPFEELSSSRPKAHVNYTRDIAPILFAHCVECHRPGQVAPFPLLTYQDAAKRAAGLARATTRRLMPPWRADIHYGEFLDERRLTERQIALIAAWANDGKPEGDPADLPPQPVFPSGWRLGQPDLVAQVPSKFTVPAQGPDIFQHFVIPLNLPKGETLVGFEFRPGNPSVVHHAIVAVDSTGGARARDAQTPEPGWRTSGSIDASITSILGVWTPGMTPRFYPDNTGVALDKTADVVVQLHLHPSGKQESDQSQIALYFAKKPVSGMVSRRPLVLGSLVLEIPPGQARYRASSSLKLPTDVTFTSVFPHMHLIGKEMKLTATLPDKSVRPLIWIKDWNFYWQDSYTYREPVKLPKGTRIDVEAWYDNSAKNPFNPSSPPKPVLFGNDTTDEMCFALFQTVDVDPVAGRQMSMTVMRSFLEQWNTAPLSPEGRKRILSEAVKLFGGRARRFPWPPPAPTRKREG